MTRTRSARLFIALLTFAIGVAAFAIWLSLRPPHSGFSDPQQVDHIISATPMITNQEPRFSSKYENPAIRGGLFYVAHRSGDYIIDPQDGYDERALVLSYDNKPIDSKANNPDAPTFPGFYLSCEVRLDFERVEVLGKKVFFKTRSVGGMGYEFSGTSGEDVIPNYDPSTQIPFIKGLLIRLKDGKVDMEEEIKFRHVVIAQTKP